MGMGLNQDGNGNDPYSHGNAVVIIYGATNCRTLEMCMVSCAWASLGEVPCGMRSTGKMGVGAVRVQPRCPAW